MPRTDQALERKGVKSRKTPEIYHHKPPSGIRPPPFGQGPHSSRACGGGPVTNRNRSHARSSCYRRAWLRSGRRSHPILSVPVDGGPDGGGVHVRLVDHDEVRARDATTTATSPLMNGFYQTRKNTSPQSGLRETEVRVQRNRHSQRNRGRNADHLCSSRCSRSLGTFRRLFSGLHGAARSAFPQPPGVRQLEEAFRRRRRRAHRLCGQFIVAMENG